MQTAQQEAARCFEADGVTVLLMQRYIKWEPEVKLELRRVLGLVDVVTKGFYI